LGVFSQNWKEKKEHGLPRTVVKGSAWTEKGWQVHKIHSANARVVRSQPGVRKKKVIDMDLGATDDLFHWGPSIHFGTEEGKRGRQGGRARQVSSLNKSGNGRFF